MSIIRIYTNRVEGGWSPNDIDHMLGGSEECVVLLAEEFAKQGYGVTVYHTQRYTDDIIRNNVLYLGRDVVECNQDDIFITFKDPGPWLNGFQAKKKIHWSSDVENAWNTSLVDHFINLTEYHQRRNFFVRNDKQIVIPHGIPAILKQETKKIPDSVLYCSSPDRGLVELLQDWKTIKKNNYEVILNIAYGFDLFDKISGKSGAEFKRFIFGLMDQPGVNYLGALSAGKLIEQYRKNEYWILPLQNPDSELFCLNAIKSREFGCIPIVNKIGALENTVGDYIDYLDFAGGSPILKESEPPVPAMSWSQIYETFWKKLL